MNRILTALVLMILMAGAALADTSIDFELKNFTKGEAAETAAGVFQIAGKNVTAEFRPAGAASSKGRIIFLGEKEVLWVINDGDKSYIELDRKTMAELAVQMKAAKAQLDEQLSKLPPEQRKMVEQSMQGALGGAEEVKAMEYRAAEERKTVNGFACRRYDILTGGAKSGEIWAAPYAAVKIEPADMAAVTRMTDFFMEFINSMSIMMPALKHARREMASFHSSVDGFPVQSRTMDGEKVESEMQLKAVRHDQIPASVFALPEGYKQQAMPKLPAPG